MDISIVTPVFNSVRCIELCLQSVRHALKGRNYEHIVVDGGSTDGTLDYLNQQKNIRLILGPHKGMYHALNKGMATARGRILGHLNADEQYDRAGLAHALQKLDQTRVDAVFRPIDADWHMPVKTCSLLCRREIWEPYPYPAEYRVVGNHAWFRRQMKLGLKLISVRKTIRLFIWPKDGIAKRLGSHGKNALTDVNRKSLRIRTTKLTFRLKYLLEGGLIRPFLLLHELVTLGMLAHAHTVCFPPLGI